MKLKQLSLIVIIAHVLLASSAFAQSTATIVTHVDKPELYTLHAPRQMNLDLVVVLKSAAPVPEVEALKAWLTQQDFKITYDGTADGVIELSGSVDVAESAFQVQMMMTSNGEGYGPLGDAKIPIEFGNVVQSIAGLSTITLAPFRLLTARPTPSAS